jgi:hypothetical protein
MSALFNVAIAKIMKARTMKTPLRLRRIAIVRLVSSTALHLAGLTLAAPQDATPGAAAESRRSRQQADSHVASPVTDQRPALAP